MKGLLLHIDCPTGIAGDMFVAAALDLGVPVGAIDAALEPLGLALGWRVVERRRGGIVGKGIEVEEHDHGEQQGHGHGHAHGGEHSQDHRHRSYRDIRPLLGRLEPGIGRRALAMFDRIAEVEARLHGVAVEEVAFHEVGALDSIFDIVAAAAALEWLAPARVSCRTVPTGTGTVSTQHGLLPVPAPATASLLLGLPVESGGVEAELTTPTGAAIVATQVEAWTPAPPMVLRAVGYGAGLRELSDRPNLLRLLAGEPQPEPVEGMVLLEANLDDMIPELAEPLMEALFGAGAADVWFTPIQMKKNRPAFQVSALAPAGRQRQVRATLLAESTTLGVRYQTVEREVLARRIETVATPFGPVEVKLGLLGDRIVHFAPEYDSVRRRAAERGVSVKTVYLAAMAEATRRFSAPDGADQKA